MANYFEVKITFDKTLDNGKEKKVLNLMNNKYKQL